MAFYATTEELYRSMEALFACVGEQYPLAEESLVTARLLVLMRTTAPDGVIVFDGRQAPMRTTFGADAVRPDFEVSLTADTLHRILLGEAALGKAFTSGLVRVKGPLWKTRGLGDLFVVSRRCYPGILEQLGYII